MNTLGDALLAFIAAIVIVAVIIGTGVFISLTRERRRMARQVPNEFGLLHDDTWDLMVNGEAIAKLTPTGPPEDSNTSFIIFDIAIIPGREAEAGRLLQQFNQREPDDERICFRSRTRDCVTLKDSQVLGTLMIGGKQLCMKAYPAENELSSDQGSSRPAT